MRGRFFILLIAVGVVAYGGQQAYVALTNRKPAKLTCADFINNHSSAKWIELSNCEVDYRSAIQLQSRILKVDKGTFVPVKPLGSAFPAPIVLQMKTEDVESRLKKELLATLANQEKGGETISGLVKFGMDSDSKVERAIKESSLKNKIMPEFMIVEAGAQPDPADIAFAVALIIGGIVVGIFMLRRSRSVQTPVAPPPLPTAA